MYSGFPKLSLDGSVVFKIIICFKDDFPTSFYPKSDRTRNKKGHIPNYWTALSRFIMDVEDNPRSVLDLNFPPLTVFTVTGTLSHEPNPAGKCFNATNNLREAYVGKCHSWDIL